MAPKKARSTTSTKAKASPAKAATAKPAGSSKKINSRQLLIGAGVVLVIISLVLLAQFFGSNGDPIAEHMPADIPLYVHVNLEEAASADAQEIVRTFQLASGEDEPADQTLQQDLADQLGVDYDQDIAPWLGKNVGIGLFDFNFVGPSAVFQGIIADLQGSTPPEVKYIIGVESRNNSAADAFVTKVREQAESEGSSVTSTDFAGGTIYEIDFPRETAFDSSADTQRLALTRAGGIVFFANSAETIQAAFDQEKGSSLASDPRYVKALAELPGKRVTTAVISSAGLEEAASSSSMPFNNLSAVQQAYQYDFTIGASVSIVDEGVQIDSVSVFDESQIPADILETLKTIHPSYDTLAFYPEDTVLYAVSGITPGAVTRAETANPEQMADFIESMDSLKSETGLDLVAVLNAFDKEVSFGVFPQTTGFAELVGTDLGLQLVVGQNDEGVFTDFNATLSQLLEQSIGAPTATDTVGPMKIYRVSDPFAGGELLAFGSGGGFAYLGTDPGLIENGFSETTTSLADSEKYQETWAHFSGNAFPTFYFDVPQLIEIISRTNPGVTDEYATFTPITLIAGVDEPYADGVSHAVIIVFVERNTEE